MTMFVDTNTQIWNVFVSFAELDINDGLLMQDILICKLAINYHFRTVAHPTYEDVCIAVALISQLVVRLQSLQSIHNKRIIYCENSQYFRFIVKFVSGRLFKIVQDMRLNYEILSPKQAPKGWICSICLQGSNSHMCVKVQCGHYLHYGCFAQLDSATCPLCRSSTAETDL